MKHLKQSLASCGAFFDLETKKNELAALDEQIATEWDNPKHSASLLKQKKALENFLSKVAAIQAQYDDLETACELATEDDDCLHEAQQLLPMLLKNLTDLETELLLGGKLDGNDAIVSINAGAGGTESCDWAAMLLRMYLRYAEQKKFTTEIYDLLDGDEAGIKNATFEVKGEYAYGLLRTEIGVHRLVRISPFDSNARRHTSFASVYVSPIVDEDIEVAINPSELRIDTYRASGAGGQHVNKTDSAVRITHLPTNTVVQCQTQRSQHQNKEHALRILQSKLYELRLAAKQQELKKDEAQKHAIAWGSQIRSYILHPYKLVKDHRSNLEHHNPDAVLDGEIQAFIQGALGLL